VTPLGRLKPWLSVALGLAFVGLGVWYVGAYWEDFAILGRLGTATLLEILGTVLVYLALGGYLLDTFLRRYGVALPWYRWFGLYVTMTVGNILTPVRGGTGMAAIYLRSAHGLSLSRYAMVLLGTYIGGAIINAATALVGMGISYWTSGWFNAIVVVAAVVVLAGGLVTLFIPNLRPSARWGWTYVVRAVNGWHELVRDRRLLGKVLGISVVMNLVHVGTYWLTYRGLGLPVSPEAVLTIVSMGNIASMISLTPASLGPYDVVLVSLPTTFGLTGPEAMAALLVMRAAHLAVTFALAGMLGFTLRTRGGVAPPDSGPLRQDPDRRTPPSGAGGPACPPVEVPPGRPPR